MNDSRLEDRPVVARAERRRLPFGVRPVLLEAIAVFSLIGLVLAAAAPFVMEIAGSDWRFVMISITVYLAIVGLAAAGLRNHPHGRFGAANVITVFRAALTAIVAASLIEAGQLRYEGDTAFSWAVAGLVVLALLLDGVDGYAARRNGTQSSFGERFDMEVDALLILLLSLLAFVSGKAGAFVILLGAMRYAYLAIHALLPRLPSDLSPSLVRKAVCVIQVSALCLIVTPLVNPPTSSVIALGALILLGASFGRDLVVQFSGYPSRKGIKR
ncbi:GTP cyclohydrolase [Fulvimarina pelagi HTCC2506]|uniref:GTP cyclohydrolase n=1 Tax=Fulvimarina pelagi HTCC2506 TaxID=314231 RepID=Q0G7E4_9HYPH|nr:GTP cyclohydrolase [Fulvimarina pelagi HTCC2506]